MTGRTHSPSLGLVYRTPISNLDRRTRHARDPSRGRGLIRPDEWQPRELLTEGRTHEQGRERHQLLLRRAAPQGTGARDLFIDRDLSTRLLLWRPLRHPGLSRLTRHARSLLAGHPRLPWTGSRWLLRLERFTKLFRSFREKGSLDVIRIQFRTKNSAQLL